MVKKDGDFSDISYVLGILSIVFAILLKPSFGLGFGITGLILIAKEKSELAKKSRKLNIIGIIISVVLLAIIAFLFTNQVLGNLPSVT